MSQILVTGAAKGLGQAICLALAKKKHAVVVHYRSDEAGAQKTVRLCQELGVEAHALQGDFETEKGVEHFIRKYLSQFGETKGVVNNVGNYLMERLSDMQESDWLSLFQTNLHAPFFLIKWLLPSLKKWHGQVVNIGTASLNGQKIQPNAPAYAITKMALYYMTRSFAKELAPEGVRFNMISPGYLETAVDLKEPIALPMKRPATLEETAHLVALLFDPEFSYVTGQNIEVSGGIGL